MKIADVLVEKMDQRPLDKKTHTIAEIAKKHDVTQDEIKKQLKMGIKVEFEHTKEKDAAREIALDHLWEIPDYYNRLDKMEKKGEEAEEKHKKENEKD